MSRTAYLALENVTGKVPLAFVTQALDDDADGVLDSDAWDSVMAGACNEVDGTLGQRYAVPFAAYPDTPPLVHQAALVFFCESLYLRRGYSKPDENPWISQADRMRAKLDAVAAGEKPLTPTAERPRPSVKTITEPARSTAASGNLSC